MKSLQIQARSRLLCAQSEDVSYEQYAQIVGSIARSTNELQAFSFGLPAGLKKLWSDLKELAQHLHDAFDISVETIVKAFQERSVFTLLKGVGFAVHKLVKAVTVAAAIPSRALFAALDDMIDTFGSSRLFQSMDVKARLQKLDQLTKSHPVLTKMTGLAVAGFLIWAFLHASTTGDVHADLGLVPAVLDCLHGNYDLAQMFGSKQGVKDLSILLFGLASGGAGITSYGVDKIENMLHFLGSHAGTVASLLTALFYSGARRLGMHLDYSRMPQPLHAVLVQEPDDKAGRTQGWYHRLSPDEKAAYRKKWPGTRFHTTTKLVLPS